MKSMRLLSLFLFLTTMFSPYAQAEDKPAKASLEKAPERRMIETNHKAKIGGETLRYKSRVFETFLKNEKGEIQASVGAIDYRLEGVKDASKRPLTFVFNGGPGSSSVWLHMGVFGPKRIRVPSDAKAVGAAPYLIEDNPMSLLAESDLVFIDPPGTGYSRSFVDDGFKPYWGVIGDAEALTSFIRDYLSENKRWNSPRYLAGESYGTVRASVLAEMLQSGFRGISVNGIMLISAILDFQAGRFVKGNNLPFVTFLPTYAASAYYHNKLPEKPENLEVFLDEVRDFAQDEYLSSLFKGSALSANERQSVIDKLHRYTGLSKNYIEQTNLRIGAFRFMKQLLRDQGKTIGRFDSRYLGEDYDDAGESFDNDASAYGIDGAYVASINHYLLNDLNVPWTDEYQILNGRVGGSWEWSLRKSQTSASYINVGPLLSKAMTENPDLRVFVANGYYDLATPFYSTEYVMSQHGIDMGRVDMYYYEAGHMMYTHEPSYNKLVNELKAFYSKGPKRSAVLAH